MKGFNGLKVFIGLLLILGVLWSFFSSGNYYENKNKGIEMEEIYRKFVDII